jgi:hypothetical protein
VHDLPPGFRGSRFDYDLQRPLKTKRLERSNGRCWAGLYNPDTADLPAIQEYKKYLLSITRQLKLNASFSFERKLRLVAYFFNST